MLIIHDKGAWKKMIPSDAEVSRANKFQNPPKYVIPAALAQFQNATHTPHTRENPIRRKLTPARPFAMDPNFQPPTRVVVHI